MGRQPKSVDEHKANGTYKPSRHDGRGITIEPLEKLPAPISLSKKAAEKWEEMVPAMLSAGLVSVVDAIILKDAFISYDIAQDCLEKVNGYDSYGEYLSNLDKIKQMNLLDVYKEHMNRFHKIMMKFGVTPEARTRMRVKPKEKDENNFFDELMKNGG
jgi:P27 family predicted phage terminase small subunit